MKFLILIFIVCSAWGQDIHHWVDEYEKKVFFVPKLELKVSLVELKESEDDWGTLIIDSNYSSDEVEKDVDLNNLKKRYRDYEFRNLRTIKSKDVISLRILPLKKNVSVQLRNSMHGVYFYLQVDLDQKNFLKIRESLLGEEKLVLIEDEFEVSMKKNEIVEEVSLGNKVCRKLFSNGNSTYSVLKNYFKQLHSLEQKEFKFNSTYESLRDNLLYGCVMQDMSQSVSSFKELLLTKLYENRSVKEIKGQTIKLENKKAKINIVTKVISYKEIK